MFEVFDHTADLGLRIHAADVNSLFAEGGRALLSVIVSNPEAVEPREELSLRVAGRDVEYLFVDWLDELLFLFESKQFLACEFETVVDDTGLSATVRGETCDPARHSLAHEVKAVTYHGLAVEQVPDGWRAEVILDI
ncbi:MAG TPA: archease [Planctomycetaceae bacterium]|nr:archease [Planctomycetaceae bacterium]